MKLWATRFGRHKKKLTMKMRYHRFMVRVYSVMGEKYRFRMKSHIAWFYDIMFEEYDEDICCCGGDLRHCRPWSCGATGVAMRDHAISTSIRAAVKDIGTMYGPH